MGITDRDVLAEQYRSDANLAARQAIYRYRTEGAFGAFFDRCLDLASLTGTETVVDVGCGNGRYLQALERRGHRGVVVGIDLSAGMAAAARDRAPAAGPTVGDAEHSPLRDGCADVTLAMHMLYHLPDRARGLRELRRITREGGRVLVATNATDHMLELDELLADSIEAVNGARPPLVMAALPFTLDSGEAELRAVFDDVVLHEDRGVLAVTEAEPIVAYALSMHAVSDETGAVRAEVARRATATIARDGALRVRTATGCFVCR